MKKDNKESFFQKHPVTCFLTICYLIGFVLLIPLMLLGLEMLGLIAASSSSIAGIVAAYLTGGKEGVKDLFSGFKKWRHNPIWYIIAFSLPLIAVLIAIGISTLLGNPFLVIGKEQWLLFPLMFIMLTIQAGLGEELGWRGFMNPKLSENNSALKSSLIVGVFWAFWHLPLYFFPSMMQYELSQKLGFFTMFCVYSIFIIAAAVIFAWIYYISDGNLWLPVIMHGALNAFGWLFAWTNIDNYGGPTMLYIMVMIWVAFAVIITGIYGPQKLRRNN